MNQFERFMSRLNAAHNQGIAPTLAHLEGQNHYVQTRPARVRTPRPQVQTYPAGAPGTRPWPVAQEAPVPATRQEASRQQQILATRLANLEKGRAILAQQRAARKQAQQQAQVVTPTETAKETAEMSEIATLKAQIAQLSAQIASLSAPAPVPAKAPKAQPVPAPAKEENGFVRDYIKGRTKLTDYGKGQRAAEINGTLVVVAWNAETKSWDYACGAKRGSAASRGLAFEAVNKLTVKAGLGLVRA